MPVVPIDVQIQPPIRVVAITGPNTGGKTVTLKTLGLAALMAKVGLFVPAREPVELPWFDQVLADIGDEQSLEQSLSTFSGHIRRISRIIQALSPEKSEELLVESSNLQLEMESGENKIIPEMNLHPSLVLLDEVGAGTDPAEGSALARALLQHLANTAQLTVATTHYGELKALKYQDQRFENASVEFDDVTLSPTYRLLWGIPGRSNALLIARRLGLNPRVVDQAQTLLGGTSDEINQVIAGLEAQRRRQETQAKEATQLLQQSERLHQEVSHKARLLQERERELKLSQERAVQEAIASAKEEIAQVIRRLQQGPTIAQNAQQATAALQEIAQRHLPAAPPAKQKPGFRPQIGDRIRIPRLNQTAEVLNTTDQDGELTVRFGQMKMTVALVDVESLDGQKPDPVVKCKPPHTPAPSVTSSPPPIVRTSKNTIDIRGSRVADAEFEIEKAMQQAIEFGTLWIIHGKGTGKLRQGVHSFLEQHPLVERFQLAEQTEGGAGVTIAHLK
jgi:DNA mismatch repair protein MutS2